MTPEGQDLVLRHLFRTRAHGVIPISISHHATPDGDSVAAVVRSANWERIAGTDIYRKLPDASAEQGGVESTRVNQPMSAPSRNGDVWCYNPSSLRVSITSRKNAVSGGSPCNAS